MAMTCRNCGSTIRPNMKKLSVVLGGPVAVMVMGAMTATPVGWLALIPAVLTGSLPALRMMQIKMKLAQASKKAGGFFWCPGCRRDVPVGEVFGD